MLACMQADDRAFAGSELRGEAKVGARKAAHTKANTPEALADLWHDFFAASVRGVIPRLIPHRSHTGIYCAYVHPSFY